MSDYWTLEEAVQVARHIESICPTFGCHVALTGGTLYKDGPRKDADFLFYNIRQIDRLDREGLLFALSETGFDIGRQIGWVTKAKWQEKDIDFFFPELFPSKSGPSVRGAY